MNNTKFDSKIISIEHITIASNKSFETVKAKLEVLLPRIDDGIFALLRYGEFSRALKELETLPPLSIFGFRDHGALLRVAGLKAHAIQYDIGNPLTVSKMTRHELSAALYAPIRVLLLEDTTGVVSFEYDRPLSTFGQFDNYDVDLISQKLDNDLKTVLEAAAA
jgi:uncharacterized protein (DUF302 family)